MAIHRLFFSYEALTDMQFYVQNIDTEICGIGRVARDIGDTLYIKEVKLLPQEVTGADVLITEEHMTAFFESIPGEEHPEWCFNWHSHVNMGVTPSGIDTTNYKKFNDLFELFIPCIMNKRNELNMWSYWQVPIQANLNIKLIWLTELKNLYHKCAENGLLPDEKTQVEFLKMLAEERGHKLTEERKAFLKAEIDANVTKKTIVYQGYGNYNQGYKNPNAPTQTTLPNVGNVPRNNDSLTSKLNENKNITVTENGVSVDNDEEEEMYNELFNAGKKNSTTGTDTRSVTSTSTNGTKNLDGTETDEMPIEAWNEYLEDSWIAEFNQITAFATDHKLIYDVEDGMFYPQDDPASEGYTYNGVYELTFHDDRYGESNDVMASEMDLLMEEWLTSHGYTWQEDMGMYGLDPDWIEKPTKGLNRWLNFYEAASVFVDFLKQKPSTKKREETRRSRSSLKEKNWPFEQSQYKKPVGFQAPTESDLVDDLTAKLDAYINKVDNDDDTGYKPENKPQPSGLLLKYMSDTGYVWRPTVGLFYKVDKNGEIAVGEKPMMLEDAQERLDEAMQILHAQTKTKEKEQDEQPSHSSGSESGDAGDSNNDSLEPTTTPVDGSSDTSSTDSKPNGRTKPGRKGKSVLATA